MRFIRGMHKWLLLGLAILFIPILCFSQDTVKTKYGWIKFNTNVDSIYVVVNNHYKNAIHIVNHDSLLMKKGVYTFTLVNKHYWDERYQMGVLTDTTMHYRINFKHKIEKDPNNSGYKRITEGFPYNLTISTDPKSTIIIDDSTYGKHFVKTLIGPYYHTLIIKHPTARDCEKKFYIEPSGQLNFSIY